MGEASHRDTPSRLRVSDRESWRQALSSTRPILVHLNADTTWLIQIPYPKSCQATSGRTRFNVLVDPWLQGPQSDVASWFSKQWHVVPSSVQTLSELNAILCTIEDGADDNIAEDGQGNLSHIDAVVVSHEFTDHCHQATLLELPPLTPIIATDQAAELIRSWGHSEKVFTAPGFSPDSTSWKEAISIENLPSWLGIGRVVTPGNSLYYHSAVMVAFESDDEDASEAILYSPHGIHATDLSFIKTVPGLETLALLHGLHDVGIIMTKQLNLGALNGIQAARESGAKYWIATHDEVKQGGGILAPFLRRTQYDLKQAIEAEKRRTGSEGEGEYNFVELGSGDGALLQ